jgi:uncharacterized membrane protein HdeD (DUF308 family)
MRLGRFTRRIDRSNRPTRIVLGTILVVAGLIGIVTAPDRVDNPSWLTYLLPATLLTLGCVHLFLARRHPAGDDEP